MKELDKNENYTNQSFEEIKHIDENGVEYWYARELMKVLSYRYFHTATVSPTFSQARLAQT